MTARRVKPKPPDAPNTGGWGFLSVMRHLERRATSKPRVGQNLRIKDEIADMGQDPYLGFAREDLSVADLRVTPPRVRPKFLGFFGPFGPLPLALSREVDHWARNGDTSFVRFADMLVARFQQLFYRSWSDARPITQFDHPSGGNFPRYLRALTGDAHRSYDDVSPIDDVTRLRYSAGLAGRVRSPVKLRQVLRAHFGVPIRIEEFVFSWLNFPPEDRSQMGLQGMSLGRDLRMGSRTPSIGEKIIIHVECPTLADYEAFLPGREKQAQLADLVLGYLGGFFAIDVALWIPKDQVKPTQLGSGSQLGWTSALPIPATEANSKLIQAAQFHIYSDA